MKIILIEAECPFPPMFGPHHHSLGVIESILRLDCELHVIANVKDTKDCARWDSFCSEYPRVRVHGRIQWRSGFALMFHQLLCVLRLRLPVLGYCNATAVEDLLSESPDLKSADWLIGDRYLVSSLSDSWRGGQKLFLPHDAYSLAAERGLAWSNSLRERFLWCRRLIGYRNMESDASERFDFIAPVSMVDVNHWKKQNSDVSCGCLPIVASEEFLCYNELAIEGGRHLLIHGLFNFEAKCVQLIDFLDYLYPKLRQRFPDLKVTLWAPDLHCSLQKALDRYPEITRMGWVDDYKEAMMTATVYYYPMGQCSGVQTKLMEAMSLGLPCVGSSETMLPLGVGSFDPNASPAWSVHDLGETEDALVQMFSDCELRKAVAKRSREYMADSFSLDSVSICLNSILTDRYEDL